MKFVSLIAAFCIVMPAPAQNVVDSAKGGQQTLSVDVDIVNVVFTVLDRKGKFITDLKQDQFRAFEDNVPQTISNFSRETGLPLTVALLIDTTGSIRDRLRFDAPRAAVRK